MRAVLLKLAELRHTPHVADLVERDPGRIKALRVLTGGNTRVLVVLYQVLAQEKDGSVISELEQLLDLQGIRLRRDSEVSVVYAEELNSGRSSVTLQSTDRHDILGQKSAGFQLSVGARDAECAPDCPPDGLLQK